MEQQYVIGVIVANVSGVLSRVSGMFTRRGFNIDSLTVGETESSGFSRITIAFHGDEDMKERILQQLQKLHDVREVEVLDTKDSVIRELLLIKVRNKAEIRQDIMTAVEIFRSKIVDYSPTSLTCELTGETSKIDAFIELLKPFGIMEMCRTGIVAIERGENCLKTVK
ncbi:MAG: acetolactate synthase small subunit [Ruminococcus sp.]|uniref:acetolactate synthase small subunit n=1 Tax=Ruminococcus flavefaciens TaxID=1265 RepID=UPI0004649056|nr:acetolactate synthase small subunit [Ruminococcus flavefaciens]MBO7394714.1 acetolactate synthase small subunit [Ruminococcus sp.]MBP5581273.1 acetolactate synthase small subunit [Ruminococcus sp.]